MLNMVKSKYTKTELDNIFVPLVLLVFLGLFVFVVYNMHKQEEILDGSGGKFCTSSTNAFSSDIQNMCSLCVLRSNGSDDATKKCETAASCYNQCDKCVTDASGADALAACLHPNVNVKVVEPFLQHVPRVHSSFAANSMVKSFDHAAAKFGAKYGRHA